MELPLYSDREQHFEEPVSPHSVCFVTGERIKSFFKILLWDDKGQLEIFPEKINFAGKHQFLKIQNFQGISLIRQTFPLLSLLLTNVIMVLLFLGRFLALLNEGEPTFLYFFFGVNIFAFWVAGFRKWIQLDYLDETGEIRKVFFSDGQWNGWGGVFGETVALFQKMNSTLLLDKKELSPRNHP